MMGMEFTGYPSFFRASSWRFLRPGRPSRKNSHLHLASSGRAGPGPNDPSSVVWLYHSHADEPKDVGSGLVGVILISRKGAAGPAGRPTDVDREFVTLFMIVDENTSWYLQHNIATYTSDPKHVEKLENSPSDHLGNYNLFGSGFTFANFRATSNGFQYANLPKR
jgi:hypothetical protein